ncbi:competence type IV pilus minor pilin ComGE [Neobacillus thermocopriae]|uniref:Type II secretion system protein n=1 Tax=Neobacillus thermocopriae TaxID=1215031 RepID=A0A6B3TRL5_9BACI|nr:competence type IV pilus minor pilin ComGE [Neobacillus thermocopriae]MED3624658.1 competence type IV pilus minor pilin ComGE [Neobacillus thermocopriae]MED3715669.1 competence type IV pilus minor pilin ComGE [Neobacillus thermocopriae]NEX78701.1 hypothetical protein [Neobacillus thermocopriae]
MLQSNKGFFLLELLLSLSIIFMISLYFIPLWINLKEQSKKLEIENKLRQIVYEQLQAKIMDDQLPQNYRINENGVEFYVYWREASGLMEVCVRVENHPPYPVTKEICGLLE